PLADYRRPQGRRRPASRIRPRNGSCIPRISVASARSTIRSKPARSRLRLIRAPITTAQNCGRCPRYPLQDEHWDKHLRLGYKAKQARFKYIKK
ncbi:hypothetical protein L249_2582, partial [Ophiocordyceps polyrhachis-furcata BCC 54312]